MSDLSPDTFPPHILATVLARLDFVVLDCPGDNSFRLVGPVPDWVTRLYPDALTSREGPRPQGRFPFLENFLIDAEEFWRTKQAGPLKSGSWVEHDERGESYQLEASALRVGKHKLLLIERLGRGFAEKQSALQQARETQLNYQQLTKEMQKKEILLHCIIHDLAGPLTAIKGSLDVLALQDLPPEEHEFLTIGQLQVAKQERLIQDILDVFAAEIESLDVVPDTLALAPDVGQCTQDVVQALSPAFSLSHVRLQLAPDSDWQADWRVVADQNQLERIISNLLDNALRHSPRNTAVTVGVYAEGNHVLTTVEDQGPGIAADMQDIVFQKFVRHKDHQRQAGRAGLGLYFCRITVERWGGMIGFTPRPTGGTRFWFRLPRPTGFRGS